MYISYLLFSSLIGAIIYEYSGLRGLGLLRVFISFVIITIINLIISNSNKRYKKNITIFTLLLTILAIANLVKVRFNLAEINTLDFTIIKAAGDVAELFLDKLPFAKIGVVIGIFIFYLIITIYTNKFDKSSDNKSADYLQKGYTKSFFSSKRKVFISIFLLIAFLFTSPFLVSYGIYSSFSNLISSSRTIAENAYFSSLSTEKIQQNVTKMYESSQYSQIDTADELMTDYPFNKQTDMDVIILQSESFFDVVKNQKNLGKSGITFDYDILKNFHYYQDNGISGELYVPTVGGGTVNTEYEVLTGYGVKYFSRGTMIFTSILKEKTDSLAYFYKNNFENTETIGIHNHTKEYWDRDRVYPLLGIDKFIDMTMFSQEQQQDLVGAWMSDKTIFDMMIKCLEENHDKNKFMLPVTVQNHGPYGHTAFKVSAGGLTDSDKEELNNYFGNLKASDDYLKALMDYIDARQKPTMVVFYGDHKPDPSYDVFKQSEYYTKNEKQNMFSTDYFIYFNKSVTDPKLLSLKHKTKNLSATALNRFIEMLLGDESKESMYIYNFTKNPENYFNKLYLFGAKNSAHRLISLQLINRYVEK